MNYWILFWIICSFFISCKSYKKTIPQLITEQSTSYNYTLLNTDTVGLPKKSDTLIRFERNSIKKDLPFIKSIAYISANTSFEKVFPKDSSFVNSLRKSLTYYHNALTNIGTYKAYYVSLDCYDTSLPKSICHPDFAVLSFGLLVLYDSIDNDAFVINVEYHYLVDAFAEDMNFTLSKSAHIYLEENYLTDSDEDESGNIYAIENLRAKHRIQINKDGKFIITETFRRE